MGKTSVLVVAHFFWIIMKSTLIQRVLFVALIPHLYYLAKIYIEVIL